ncbi:hypothetical protein PAXINDRAFT_14528 [Paxillus involutus ATCC 200175]|uniref:DUF6830 domain-containing protein n=1 Tax=Paxillus involutus ATCC 200175 TaxID=664439 RepID=A0A0C9TZ93_PAXIN|nr:hypothetical protein PAXINDRAFT_14528 [Paxillus involutus ATCC 200175]
MIQQFGATDNYNTEYTERLHIDLAKDAYRATNHKDEYSQMTAWLERQEKMVWHLNYIRWRTSPDNQPVEPIRCPSMQYLREFKMTKHPSVKAVPIDRVVESYGAQHFRAALARFVVLQTRPNARSHAQIEREAEHVHFPFTSVPVYHKIKYNMVDSQGRKDLSTTIDAVHVKPQGKDSRGRTIPGRFDTVLVNVGDGGERGVQGYRVAQVRVVFSIPRHSRNQLLPPHLGIAEHLAYVEWFTPFTVPNPIHGMYKVSRSRLHGDRLASIIPVTNIRRSVHLIPKFGRVAPREWTSSTVLEVCNDFLVNPFTDRHAYLTIL